MRQLPNIISISRIILSFLIFFTNPHSILFMVIYIVCGLSDMVDGLIARKFSLESDFGARLDSFADIVFVVIILIKLLPVIKVPHYVMYWIILIACMRISSMLIVRFRFHSFAVLHTYLNKLTGLTLFLFPLVYKVIEIGFLTHVICIIATFSAAEEMIIHLSSKELRLDTKGLWKNTL